MHSTALNLTRHVGASRRAIGAAAGGRPCE